MEYARIQEKHRHVGHKPFFVIPMRPSLGFYRALAQENILKSLQHNDELIIPFKNAWLYVTLLHLLHHLSRIPQFERPAKDTLRKLGMGNLNIAEQSLKDHLINYVIRWFKNLKKVGPIERFETEKEPINEETLFAVYEKIGDQSVSLGVRILIFYDQLDELWAGDQLSILALQGLLHNIMELQSLRKTLKPILLLRDDIFEMVTENFQHLDKLEENIEQITWSETDIVELLALRIKSSLSHHGRKWPQKMQPEEFWHLVFPEEIPAKKKPIPVTAYMVERTLLRPRDIILFAKYAQEEALNKKHSKVEVIDLKEAEIRYSRAKLRDLISQINYRYPGIKKLLESFYGRTVGYDIEDLRIYILELIESLKSEGLYWLSDDEREVIKFLFKIGFLSYTERGGVLRGTRVIHSGNRPEAETILEQKRIYISPIFRRALALKER